MHDRAAREEQDDDSLLSIDADAKETQKLVEDLEFRRMFSNPMDPCNCFIDIQAGAGGTEAQDWASMILRQYLRYCERKGFNTTILEQSDGEIAGIKTATIKVEGDYAYGYLRTETGVHRLVRKSPFDSANGRHTSFCSLFVYPGVDDSIEIDITKLNIAQSILIRDMKHPKLRFLDPENSVIVAVKTARAVIVAEEEESTEEEGSTDAPAEPAEN